MPMLDVTYDQVVAALRAVGLSQGDGLLVHSAVQYFGRPVGGVGMYLEALRTVIDPGGTLAVPTFNFAFAKGEPYDPQETPAVGMGAFSEYIRRMPEAQRTLHPLQSLAVIGQHAADLAGRDTPSAFDPGSAFERMLALDFKLLLLGADSKAVSMFHYSERRANVPYRYWKDFTGPVKTSAGTWQERTYRMFVRDLELNPILTLDPVVAYLQQRGEWLDCPLNYGQVVVCRLSHFVAAADKFLADDPWSLVTNRPL